MKNQDNSFKQLKTV